MSTDTRQSMLELVQKTRTLVGEMIKRKPGGIVRLEEPLKTEETAPNIFESRSSTAHSGGADPKAPWAEQMWDFKVQISDCMRCSLGSGRKNFVFGEGNKDADLMFVGEAPGRDEDAQGRPFVGQPGQLLERIIRAMGFRRDQVFIANLVKCRPPENREPLSEEIDTCRPYIEHQIKLVKPRVIVALGRFAALSLLKTETGIGEFRGQWKEYEGIPVMPTFHPADVLADVRNKRPVWEDMKMVMRKLSEEKNA